MEEKTFQYQNQLPSLPAFSLPHTLKCFLRSAKAVVSEEEYKEVESIVADFTKEGGVGLQLQSQIDSMSKSSRNWLEKMWLDHGYLTARYPSAIWVNYYAPYWDTPIPGATSQSHAAAVFLHCVLRFREMIYAQTLPVQKTKKKPLCMDQYLSMFPTRLPGETRDILVDNSNSTHIVIFHKNQMFKMEVFDDKGKIRTLEEFERTFKKIINSLKNMTPTSDDVAKYPGMVGVLTSLERHKWARTRLLIRENPQNALTLHVIESALLTVTLESEEVWPSGPDEVAQLLHNGRGYDRWYDKATQLIITPNRYCGVNCEHSPADAPVQIHMSQWCRERVAKEKHMMNLGSHDDVKPLKTEQFFWDNPQKLTPLVLEGKAHFDELASSVKLHIFRFFEFGEKELNARRVASDFFIQHAMQLAAVRLYGHPVNTYETGQLRQFYHGRTETVRPCSLECVEWIKAMENEKTTRKERQALFFRSVTVLKNLLISALSAKGFDRHMFALRVLNVQSGLPLHPLFTHKTFMDMFTFKLSTSNIGRHEIPLFGGFAQACTDGIGACYTVQEHSMCWSLAADKNAPSHISSRRFARYLQEALFDTFSLLDLPSKI